MMRYAPKRETVVALGGVVLSTMLSCSGSKPPPPGPAGKGAAAGSAEGAGDAGEDAAADTAYETLVSGGLRRHYRLHLPADDRAGRPLPVVLAFHGRGESARKIQSYAGLDGLPAIVGYPQGEPSKDEADKRSWQGAPYAAGADDVQFVRDLLEHLQRTRAVDPKRVYATGKSNGGGFAALLACRMADRIAAVAPVAGAYYPPSPPCQPSRPVPVLELHGTEDPVIAYEGNAKKGVPPIGTWLRGWAERDGCTRGPTVFMSQADITAERWSGCAGGSAVEHYRIAGGGHTWPGATVSSGPGATTHTIDAAKVLWSFFIEHPLPP
ncbi:alpha/beta hydrolase family esterase [Pendulispora albinea]|uniref:Dienelactone hydrolase family protein n=1 Tax=Pendulispora albinea TaxID=2741071 RepID=A0ABZ2M7Q8_9BACT